MEFIAEFCQNHNGDFEILKDMVWAASENGADYVKIQNIFAEMLTFRERFEEHSREVASGKAIKRPFKNEYERLKKLELTYEQQRKFIELCQKAAVKPLTTVFTVDSARILKELGFNEIKIASYDCGSLPMLREVKKLFKRVIISTGASFLHEIEAAAEILCNEHDATFLHCVTIYPTPLEEFNLARMDFLRRYTKKVGWSDHSLVTRDGIRGTVAAMYYGADVIERHFTILPQDKTKDGPVSIGPEQLRDLRQLSGISRSEMGSYLRYVFPDYQKTWGKSDRALTAAELLNRDYYRGRFASRRKDGSYRFNWEVDQ